MKNIFSSLLIILNLLALIIFFCFVFTGWNFQVKQLVINGVEATALIITVWVSFYILRKQLESSKKNTELVNQPFIISSNLIKLSHNDPWNLPNIDLKNIGGGPGLFIRISFVDSDPDSSENATLDNGEPHSFYLGKLDTLKDIKFDLRSFYKFIVGTDEGGELACKIYNSESEKKLIELIKGKVNNDFFMYFHLEDILGTSMVFRSKYRLIITQEGDNFVDFGLKRMEVQLITGKVSL